MKVANDSRAPFGMTILAVAFVLVMAIVVVWPRLPNNGDQNTGYASGEAVQSDTVNVLNPVTSPKDDRSARR